MSSSLEEFEEQIQGKDKSQLNVSLDSFALFTNAVFFWEFIL